MKLQCPCGAKYRFDLSPEMVAQPVKFVCPSCGLDSSAAVNELIRQELGDQAAAAPAAGAAPLRVFLEQPPSAPAAEAPVSPAFCAKHPGERTTEKCFVCQKPICPKCLELFGYFCSPLCKGKAEQHNLKAPVYAARRDLVEAKFWRKTGLVFGSIVTVLLLLLAAWTWYAWYGSLPHPCLSIKYATDDRAYAGSSELTDNDQFVFLHGGTLARYDLKHKKEIWSRELIAQAEIDAVVKQENEVEQKMNSGGGYQHWINAAQLERTAKRLLQSQLRLRVAGRNIWVGRDNSLTHYDWDTGKALRTVTLPERAGEWITKGDDLVVYGDQSVVHVNLASGDVKVERLGGPGGGTLLASTPAASAGGLSAADYQKALDPQKVETQVQSLSTPGRLALPALLANAEHERQLENELNDDLSHPLPNPARGSPSPKLPLETSRMVPGSAGFAQFSARLLEEHFVTRDAMKAPPKKSVVNGQLTEGQTTEAANEMLNEMQRNRGGGTVTVNESRYQVTVHLPQSPDTPDWVGEVVGPPQLFVLKTVNVIAAGKQVIVLDKSNQPLWQARLTYDVPVQHRGAADVSPQFGAGPCVEQDGTLYVYDQAVLTAYALNSGNARWRLPSVGIVGLFFDNHNDVYVNTTTGNPDDLKYSRQIDISRKTEAVLFKIDGRTGKILWRIQPGGFIAYLSGDYLYAVQSYDPSPTDEEIGNDLTAALQKRPFLSIARIRPRDGRVLWDYTEQRCPVDARFDKNSIQLIYKGEVQVLRYLVL